MRALMVAASALALVAITAPPASAGGPEFSIGPGGVQVYPRHHHRGYGYGADCRNLREACLKKEELGEEGRGNCRRYGEICG
jgi:hypothetical protein